MTDRFAEYVNCRKESGEYVGSVAEMFGIYDNKGREIGYRCAIVEECWVTTPTARDVGTVVDARWLPKYLDRPIFKVRPIPTRDGKDYADSMHPKIVFSKDDAEALAAKMIAAYRNKMAKKFA
jgi:hypothetical protein